MSKLYAARLRHAQHYKEILAAMQGLYAGSVPTQQSALEQFEREQQNIFTALKWATDLAASDDAAAELCIHFLSLGSPFLTPRQHAAERARSLEAGVKAARRLGHQAFESMFLNQLGNTYFVIGQYEKAVAFTRAANGVEFDVRGIGDEALLLSYGGNPHADTARVVGEIDRKRAFFELTELLRRSLEGEHVEAHSHNADFAQSAELAECALSGFREKGDKVNEAAALSALGMAYAEAGEVARAAEVTQQARRIYRELQGMKDRRGEADLVSRLVWFYAALRDVRTATELAAEALTLYQQAKDASGEMLAQATLGVLRSLMGEHGAAVEHHERALELARRLGDSMYEAAILGQLAVCAEQLGDPVQMLSCSEAAAAALERAGLQGAGLLGRSLEAEKGRGN